MADLNDIAAGVARIDERTQQMQERIDDAVEGLSRRVDQEREDRKDGDAHIRKELKRLPSAIAAAVAAAVAGLTGYFGGNT